MDKEKIIKGKKLISYHKGTIIQFGSLILVIVVFSILTGGAIFNRAANTIIFQVTPLIIMGVGVMFIYAHGGMDVAAGSIAGLSGTLMVLVINATGQVWLGILVAVIVSVAGYVLMCISSTKFGLMPIIASLALMFVFNGIMNGLINGYNGTISMDDYNLISDLRYNTALQIALMVILVVAGTVLLNFTAFGKFDKAIGDNALSAEQSGANVFRVKLVSYLLAGFCVGLSSVFLVVGSGDIQEGFAASYMLEVMIAIILGGMAISGGRNTKISAIVVGAISLRLIEIGLIMIDKADYFGLIKGILFLLIVGLTIRQSKNNKILP